LEVTLQFGAAEETPKQRKISVSDFLRVYQPAIGLGRDESESGERETIRSLRKRIISPMMRVMHILLVLRGEVLSLPEGAGSWPYRLLRSDPTWAVRVIERSGALVELEVSNARALGLRTASPERMIHFHLPSHLQILPPPP
jgi:hypothetical protein